MNSPPHEVVLVIFSNQLLKSEVLSQKWTVGIWETDFRHNVKFRQRVMNF